jgi:FtsP/CotA-like multicopper oxidase with cupredoxin domain
MLTIKSKWMRLGLFGMALTLAIGLTALALPKKASAATPHNVGVVCSEGDYNPASKLRVFNLVAQEGYINLTDGNTMYMWGFGLAPASGNANTFQYPGPVLCANQDDIVTVTLQNALTQDVSIIFPGQTDVSANGSPAQPQFDGSTLTSLTTSASARVAPAAMGGSVTYSFTAGHPGTYIYESGTNTKMQVGMGLFGVLIVHPSGHTDYVYDQNSQITPGEDFLAVLSEIDPLLHQAVEAHKNFNMNNYHPRYWVLNGRGFPDTIADNFATWLPNQPYGALALIQPYDAVKHPYPAVERFVNVGTEDYPFHPHGQNGLVIARDGHLLKNGTDDLSMEKFLVNIGPGQTWDVLFKWHDAEGYSDAHINATAPFPVTLPDVANQTMGMFYSGSPFLGVKGTLPPGQSTLNECGEYYIISHNHALFQLDAWGQTMSGPITYLRIDPPGGCK